MRKNRTAKVGIIGIIFLLTIAFAAVSTTLNIDGTTSVKSNQEDFDNNVVFSDGVDVENTAPYIEDLDGQKSTTMVPTLSDNGKKITFTTDALEYKEDTIKLHYWISNKSANYDAKLNELTCTATPQGATEHEYIKVTPANVFNTKVLKAGTTTETDDTVSIKMIRSYVGNDTSDTLTYKIACSITANAEETDVDAGAAA